MSVYGKLRYGDIAAGLTSLSERHYWFVCSAFGGSRLSAADVMQFSASTLNYLLIYNQSQTSKCCAENTNTFIRIKLLSFPSYFLLSNCYTSRIVFILRLLEYIKIKTNKVRILEKAVNLKFH